MDREILYKFFEGATSYEEEVAIRQWMEFSPENKRIFLKERKLFDAMLLLGKEKEIKKKKISLYARYSSLRTEVLKIASVVLITLSFNFVYQYTRNQQDAVAMQTIYVPAGQRINMTLPDGTNVWLNARTKIQYPAVFAKDKRQVILDGEAYFDVTKNKRQPFIVETNKCNLEVLGTKFNVDAYADREDFEATLMEGSVRVLSVTDPNEKLTLAPDSKAYLKEGKLMVAHVDDYNPYRWKEGLICFKNESFASIMKEFEKYYGVNIQIKQNKALKYFFTGKFRQTDGIDYALRVLQRDIKFEYTRDDENQRIYIK